MTALIGVLRRNPDFTRLWLAQAISLLGDWFNAIVLAALVSKYSDGSGLAVSLLLLARFLPPLLVSPAAGVLLDRFDRKRLLIFSDVARVFIVLGFLLVNSAEQLWLIYALTILQFAVSAVFEPGRSAILPSVTHRGDLIQANILSSVTWSVMLAIGGVTGGLVAGALGTAPALIIDAATFALSAILIAQMRVAAPAEVDQSHEQAPTPQKASMRDFIEGLRYARAHPPVAAALLVKAGGNIGSIDTILIIYATSLFVLGVDGQLSLGVLWAAFGVGAVIGPFAFNRFNDGSVRRMRRLITLAYAIITLSWLVIGAAPTLALAALGIIVKAVGSSVYWTYSSVILQQSVEDSYIGRMFSLDWSGFQAATVLSVIATGAALEVIGVSSARTVVYATAAASLIPLALWAFTLPRIERYERARESAQSAAPSVPLPSA